MIILGIGLLILWLVQVAYSGDAITWLDGLGGVLSIVAGALLAPRLARAAHIGEPLVLAIGLFVLWIVALAVGMPLWKAWWNFAFACAYLILTIAAGGSERWVAPRGQQPV